MQTGIGIIHTLRYIGTPRYVLTDNMKSMVLHQDFPSCPIWQKDYEGLWELSGSKPSYVIRSVRLVKEHFSAGHAFWNTTSLNRGCLSLAAAGLDLKKRREERKIVIVFSDGLSNGMVSGRKHRDMPETYVSDTAIHDT